MSTSLRLFATAVLCGALYTGAALAQPYGFTDYQRALVGDWIVQSRGGCPSGSRVPQRPETGASLRCIMANGSGIVLYSAGQMIPDTIAITEVPAEIVAQLPAPTMGEVYVVADNNLYLITPTTRTVSASVIVMKPE